MGGWKSRFVTLLIVYFAGFATAIYFWAPVPERLADEHYKKVGDQGLESNFASAFKSDEFARSFGKKLHRLVDFSKEKVWQTSGFIKKELGEELSERSPPAD